MNNVRLTGPIVSCTEYTDADFKNRIHLTNDMASKLRERYGVFYKQQGAYSAEDEPETPVEVLRTLLLAGGYGDFPVISFPGSSTLRLINVSGALLDMTDLMSIVDAVCSSVSQITCKALRDNHEGLYRVVYFLTCIRHEVIAADMLKRNIPWKPLVSFENPFYYVKGKMENWVSDNNILRAEVIEFIYDVFHFLLISRQNRNDHYNFLIPTLSSDDIKKLHLWDYLNTDDVMNETCYVVTVMNRSLNLLSALLKRLPVPENNEKVKPETLLQTVQAMFNQLYSLERYIENVPSPEVHETYELGSERSKRIQAEFLAAAFRKKKK